MTITERIDGARRDFLREFRPADDPYAVVLSDAQWKELGQSRLAHSRLTKDRIKGADVQQYAGLFVLIFLPVGWGKSVGPMVVSEDCAKRLLDNQIAGLA